MDSPTKNNQMDPYTNMGDFNSLPDELIMDILLKVSDLKSLSRICLTNKRVRAICKDENFWKTKLHDDYPIPFILANQIRQTSEFTSWKYQYQLAYIGIISSPVSVGHHHYAIIDNRGMLYMGGSNQYGQLGIGSIDSRELLISKISPFKKKVISVSCSENFTGAVTEDGKVYFWGFDLQGISDRFRLGTVKSPQEFSIQGQGKAVKISCGKRGGSDRMTTVGLIMEDRSVILRMNIEEEDITGQTVTLFNTIPKIYNVFQRFNLQARDISAGNHSLAIVSTQGELFYLGLELGGDKYLGFKLNQQKLEINPQKISIPEAVSQVSVGGEHIGAVTVSGNVYMWGLNEYGQLGQGWTPNFLLKRSNPNWITSRVSKPQKLDFPSPIKSIHCQYLSTAAITISGEMYVWGVELIPPESNTSLGNVFRNINQESEFKYFTRPVKLEINGGLRVKYISIGSGLLLAVTEDRIINKWKMGED